MNKQNKKVSELFEGPNSSLAKAFGEATGVRKIQDLESWKKSKEKFDKKMDRNTRKGPFSKRVDYIMDDYFHDYENPMDWIKAILQVADERKL